MYPFERIGERWLIFYFRLLIELDERLIVEQRPGELLDDKSGVDFRGLKPRFGYLFYIKQPG